ncbi:MAG: hypothetical protein FJ398_08465 [Verrucomicrobia bacterium]|nr:hypothetical protein [Verrucomicrobiota bacterium]
MKTWIATFTSLAVLGMSAPSASAGDKEWATAGKVLTGLVAGAVIAKSFEPVPVYHAPAYYAAPVVQAPPPVVVQHAPVVVYPQPVYVQPRLVYVRPAPVYVAPRPVVSFSFGFGPHHHHHGPPVFRHCR